MILARNDVVDVPLFEVIQILLGRGLGAQSHKVAPVGQASQIMPGAYPYAAIGHGQDGATAIRIDTGREKGAVILRWGISCTFKNCVRSGKGGILLPDRGKLIVLLQVNGKAVNLPIQAEGVMQNYSGEHGSLSFSHRFDPFLNPLLPGGSARLGARSFSLPQKEGLAGAADICKGAKDTGEQRDARPSPQALGI